jgi:diguanylate cyclase (GGDEF)-like protein
VNEHPHISRAARPTVLVGSALVGLGGWLYLFLGGHWLQGAGPSAAGQGALPFALFLGVILGSRALATRLLPDAAVALDSGFYVAATVCLGAVPAGRLVAIALTVDSLWRVTRALRGGGRGRPPVRWADAVSFVLYFGGMSGALLAVVGSWFQVDRIVIGGSGEGVVLGTVLGIGAVFLFAHYSIQGARLAWLGQSLATYVRRMALPALTAEATLLPLAAIIVFLWDPARPLKFVLLAATYLVMNYAFQRLGQTGAILRRRVAELETLNIMGHRLASSLQTRELVETVARETLAAIPEAEILTLTHRPDGQPDLVVDWFERGRPGERLRPEQDGLAARVMEEGRSLHIDDLDRFEGAPASAAQAGMRSWVGVPVEIYGAVAGALSIQSRSPHAFSHDHVRLIEAIGSQAAVALQNARLYELAMVDGLTTLFVRRYFDARLDEEIERSKRFGTEFSVVMMDIDDFKHLNDSHGHQAGDRLLRTIAETVRRQMRAVDTAARYGGEEFAMILPRTSMVDAYNQAERIRQQIADIRFTVDGAVLSVTASFGIASYPESKAAGAEALIRLADRALYRAKRTGKNRVELYWADDDPSARLSVV